MHNNNNNVIHINITHSSKRINILLTVIFMYCSKEKGFVYASKMLLLVFQIRNALHLPDIDLRQTRKKPLILREPFQKSVVTILWQKCINTRLSMYFLPAWCLIPRCKPSWLHCFYCRKTCAWRTPDHQEPLTKKQAWSLETFFIRLIYLQLTGSWSSAKQNLMSLDLCAAWLS